MKTEEFIKPLKNLPYFTKQNISLAHNIKGESLNYWIKKLLNQKIICTIKKGMYTSSYYQELVAEQNQKESYLEYLANIIRFPSYISLEYVLSKYNFIPESATAITSICTKTSRQYGSFVGTFLYRSIKNNLFFGFEYKSFADKEVKIASLSKALFDFLYLRPFISRQQLAFYLKEEARFNWSILSNNDKAMFVQTCIKSGSKKMKLLVNILTREKIL